MEKIENYPGVKILKNDGNKDAKLPDIIPTITSNNSKKVEVKRKDFKLKSPFITLLERESTKERIFHPSSIQFVNDTKDAFKYDYISFSTNGKRPAPEDNKLSYKKTKMEAMK